MTSLKPLVSTDIPNTVCEERKKGRAKERKISEPAVLTSMLPACTCERMRCTKTICDPSILRDRGATLRLGGGGGGERGETPLVP